MAHLCSGSSNTFLRLQVSSVTLKPPVTDIVLSNQHQGCSPHPELRFTQVFSSRETEVLSQTLLFFCYSLTHTTLHNIQIISHNFQASDKMDTLQSKTHPPLDCPSAMGMAAIVRKAFDLRRQSSSKVASGQLLQMVKHSVPFYHLH